MLVVVLKVLSSSGQIVSFAEGRRMVLGGTVRLNGQTVVDPSLEIEINVGDVLTVGARRRVEITQELLDLLSNGT